MKLFRPFSVADFVAALPSTVRADRGARPHEGTRRHRRTALPGRGHGAGRSRSPPARRRSRRCPRVIGGRYGLGSKEFTPAMVKAVFDELAKPAAQAPLHGRHRRRRDRAVADGGRDGSKSSRPTRCARCSSASAPTARSARTRTRSRSSAKRPTNFAQGYFVYDSKKSGAITISHLRFGPRPIHAPYLIVARIVRRLPPVQLPRSLRRPRRTPSRAACSC